MLENNTNQSLSHSGSILRRVTGPSTVDGCDSVFSCVLQVMEAGKMEC